VKRVSAVLYLFLFLCPLGLAQSNDASLTGSITDQSHSAVVNAKVTARNKSTNFTQSVTTDASGNYSFLRLPIGNYHRCYSCGSGSTPLTAHRGPNSAAAAGSERTTSVRRKRPPSAGRPRVGPEQTTSPASSTRIWRKRCGRT